MTFGERVKAARLDKGMSVADLAKAADLSETYIRNIEKGIAGNKRPTVGMIKALSDALGVSLTENNVSEERAPNSATPSPLDILPADQRPLMMEFVRRMRALPDDDRAEMWEQVDLWIRMKEFELKESKPVRKARVEGRTEEEIEATEEQKRDPEGDRKRA